VPRAVCAGAVPGDVSVPDEPVVLGFVCGVRVVWGVDSAVDARVGVGWRTGGGGVMEKVLSRQFDDVLGIEFWIDYFYDVSVQVGGVCRSWMILG
jgi:hypothetical protein